MVNKYIVIHAKPWWFCEYIFIRGGVIMKNVMKVLFLSTLLNIDVGFGSDLIPSGDGGNSDELGTSAQRQTYDQAASYFEIDPNRAIEILMTLLEEKLSSQDLDKLKGLDQSKKLSAKEEDALIGNGLSQVQSGALNMIILLSEKKISIN
jgi:hypothetical protein